VIAALKRRWRRAALKQAIRECETDVRRGELAAALLPFMRRELSGEPHPHDLCLCLHTRADHEAGPCKQRPCGCEGFAEIRP
jgi:hypothetical protein